MELIEINRNDQKGDQGQGQAGKKEPDGEAGELLAIRLTEASEEGYGQLERVWAELARASSWLAMREKYS